MNTIVIDPWSRGLQTFVASVVQSAEVDETGKFDIHLRFAVDMGNLPELAAGDGPWRENRGFGSEELGLIILGSTYRAQSSAGFTEVITPYFGNAEVTAACGCLGTRSLRKIKPQKAWVWGPGKWLLFPIETHRNSNCATAVAALEGLKFLAKSRWLVIIAEGQSDSVSAWAIGGKPKGFEGNGSNYTYGLRPLGAGGLMSRDELMALPVEHHRFTAAVSAKEVSPVAA